MFTISKISSSVEETKKEKEKDHYYNYYTQLHIPIIRRIIKDSSMTECLIFY